MSVTPVSQQNLQWVGLFWPGCKWRPAVCPGSAGVPGFCLWIESAGGAGWLWTGPPALTADPGTAEHWHAANTQTHTPTQQQGDNVTSSFTYKQTSADINLPFKRELIVFWVLISDICGFNIHLSSVCVPGSGGLRTGSTPAAGAVHWSFSWSLSLPAWRNAGRISGPAPSPPTTCLQNCHSEYGNALTNKHIDSLTQSLFVAMNDN